MGGKLLCEVLYIHGSASIRSAGSQVSTTNAAVSASCSLEPDEAGATEGDLQREPSFSQARVLEGEQNAEDTKSGAGQYFTPRALIRAMVECVRPEPGNTIADPACGTGGFFLAAYDFIANPKNFQLDKKQKAFIKHEAFYGNEIVANTRRLCLMNMFLHNIGEIDGRAPISPNDSLVADSGQRFDYVLANPPFGKKSSMSFTNDEGEQETDDLTYNRQDFWATTSNKQLNFVQHIRTMLKGSPHETEKIVR